MDLASRIRLWVRQDIERWHAQAGGELVIADEIVPGDRSGGANTSHTIVVPALRSSSTAVDRQAELAGLRAGGARGQRARQGHGGLASARSATSASSTCSARLAPVPSARDLWTDDPAGQPLLAGLCALARDAVFRASAPAILDSAARRRGHQHRPRRGRRGDLPGLATATRRWRRSAGTPSRRGSRPATSRPWHAPTKVRRRAVCTPSTTAYALLLGHLEGVRGAALFDTLWAQVLDQPRRTCSTLRSWRRSGR